MSRVILGAHRLLLTVVMLCANVTRAENADDLFADGNEPVEKTKAHSEAVTRVENIEAVLDAPLKAPLLFEEQALNEVINELQEAYDLPILFDQAALDEVAISPKAEITVNLRNISLRSALNLMLRQPGLEDLTYVVDEEVLLITTREKANEKLVVEVYQVDDLIKDYSHPKKGGLQHSSLVNVITHCLAFDAWMANGSGEGEIRLMKPGMLVVMQTRQVHDQVRDLLEKLRTTRKEIDQSMNENRDRRF